VLLLVAERREDDVVVPIVERATITRLGQGVDKSRALAPEAVRRTLECISRYAEDIRSSGVSAVAAVGTSAMRDAEGGDAFRTEVARLIGAPPRVISGREEAELTFEGALTGLGLEAGPVTVVDIGGGSTEIVTGDVGGGVGQAVSLDVGSVRLTERHVRSDPPTPDELEAVRADVRAALEGAGVAPRGALVGVAGTVTTIAAYTRDVVPYDSARVHGMRLSRTEVESTVRSLAAMPLLQRRAAGAIDPARADVIVAGGILLDEMTAWGLGPDLGPKTGKTGGRSGESHESVLIVSDRGVRWGLVWRMLEGQQI
jgi:exopolyphosphatase / guanosine-5'-triphosphate,3'-diphosphate pyrophosphatase